MGSVKIKKYWSDTSVGISAIDTWIDPLTSLLWRETLFKSEIWAQKSQQLFLRVLFTALVHLEGFKRLLKEVTEGIFEGQVCVDMSRNLPETHLSG